LQQFPSEAQARVSLRPALAALPSPASAEPADTPRIVLIRPRIDPVLNDPLRQFPTEAPERVHVASTQIHATLREASSGERFNEVSLSQAKPELRTIERPRVVPAATKRSMRWTAAIMPVLPVVVVALMLTPPIARMRHLVETARAAQTAQAEQRLNSFPISVRLSPDLQPAIAPHGPLSADLFARTRASAPPTDAVPTVPATPAGGGGESSPGSSAFHGSLSVTSAPEGAQVLVNGVFFGITPLTIVDMPVGSRVIRIDLDGYERWSSLVRIVANEPIAVTAVLRPSPTQ
jgi:hypothetical protein